MSVYLSISGSVWLCLSLSPSLSVSMSAYFLSALSIRLMPVVVKGEQTFSRLVSQGILSSPNYYSKTRLQNKLRGRSTRGLLGHDLRSTSTNIGVSFHHSREASTVQSCLQQGICCSPPLVENENTHLCSLRSRKKVDLQRVPRFVAGRKATGRL